MTFSKMSSAETIIMKMADLMKSLATIIGRNLYYLVDNFTNFTQFSLYIKKYPTCDTEHLAPVLTLHYG